MPTGYLGLSLQYDTDEFDLGGKVLFKVKDEENLHVDVIAGVGIANVDPDVGSSETAKWAKAGVGIEYFFSGLPNLGFSTEVGFTVMDFDDDTSFGTSADTFVDAGIHYYFNFLSPSVKKPVETTTDE